MRLWHKDLIPVLPRQQLLAQWRECCCIAKNIAEKGTPNHLLVNRIIDYSEEHFLGYCKLVYNEIINRGYKADWEKIDKYFCSTTKPKYYAAIFCYWHNDRYLLQCYYNLQEKYDCGGITEDEWGKIAAYMENKFLDDYIKRMRGI